MKFEVWLVCLALVVQLTIGARPRSFPTIQSEALRSDHLITSLPGFSGPLPSRHYGGYITVDEKRGRHLYYYFVESEGDPAVDPVVLWLNGGPGCSSFDGFIYEHGPFSYSMDAQGQVRLTRNPYAWTSLANIIYLDSPAGVGLSYSQHAGDYATNDTHTAHDADTFLRAWFSKFPRFQGNAFYITGESYGGIYVPNLARHVAHANDRGSEPYLNLKGYMVGNGCTDERYDGNAHPPFAVGKSLIGVRTYEAFKAACGGEYWNATDGTPCGRMYAQLWDMLSPLNVYDVLEACYHGTPRAARPPVARSSASPSSSSSRTARTTRHSGLTQQEHAVLRSLYGQWPLGGAVRAGRVDNWATLQRKVASLALAGGNRAAAQGAQGSVTAATSETATAPERLRVYVPCTDESVADAWLNDPAVRAALHAAPLAAIGRWTLCSDKILYTKDSGSMIPVHQELTQRRGLRALIYSGDHDMAVPHTGTEAWTGDMGYAVHTPWQAWYVADQQVAGYMVQYAHDLTYATVKGSGHMVPENKPQEALALFQHFLDPKANPLALAAR